MTRRITGDTATAGATVTLAGTPGGQALAVATITGATVTWSTSNVPSGVTGKTIRVQATTGTDTFLGGFSANSAAPLAGQLYMYIASLTGVWAFGQFRVPGQNGGLQFDASRHLQITNAGGTVLKTGTTVVPTGAIIRVDILEDPATSTTGQYTYAWAFEHSQTYQEVLTPTAPGANLGTADPTEFRFGKFNAVGTGDIYFWGYADNTAATGLIDPVILPVGAATSAVSWGVKAAVAQSSSTGWSVRQAVGPTSSAAWGVRQAVAKTSVSSWNAAATVGKTSAVGWGVRQQVDKTGSVEWDVAAALSTVAKTVAVAWAVGGSVAASAAVAWAVRAGISKTTPIAWATRQSVAASSTAQWAVHLTVTSSAGVLWSVTAPLTNTVDVAWASRALVGQTAPVSWDVHHGAVRDITVTGRLLPSPWSGRLLPSPWSGRLLEAEVIEGSLEFVRPELGSDVDISGDLVEVSFDGRLTWLTVAFESTTQVNAEGEPERWVSVWRILVGPGQAIDPADNSRVFARIHDNPEIPIVYLGPHYVDA